MSRKTILEERFESKAWCKLRQVPSNHVRVECFFRKPELLSINTLWYSR